MPLSAQQPLDCQQVSHWLASFHATCLHINALTSRDTSPEIIRAAQFWNIKIVSRDWLEQSANRMCRLPDNEFVVDFVRSPQALFLSSYILDDRATTRTSTNDIVTAPTASIANASTTPVQDSRRFSPPALPALTAASTSTDAAAAAASTASKSLSPVAATPVTPLMASRTTSPKPLDDWELPPVRLNVSPPVPASTTKCSSTLPPPTATCTSTTATGEPKKRKPEAQRTLNDEHSDKRARPSSTNPAPIAVDSEPSPIATASPDHNKSFIVGGTAGAKQTSIDIIEKLGCMCASVPTVDAHL
jgi:hypothetical protein